MAEIVNLEGKRAEISAHQARIDLTARMMPVMVEAVEKMRALGADSEHIVWFLQATIEEIRAPGAP
jgi:hypothetical protein